MWVDSKSCVFISQLVTNQLCYDKCASFLFLSIVRFDTIFAIGRSKVNKSPTITEQIPNGGWEMSKSFSVFQTKDEDEESEHYIDHHSPPSPDQSKCESVLQWVKDNWISQHFFSDDTRFLCS